jgi:hypothetical protein
LYNETLVNGIDPVPFDMALLQVTPTYFGGSPVATIELNYRNASNFDL